MTSFDDFDLRTIRLFNDEKFFINNNVMQEKDNVTWDIGKNSTIKIGGNSKITVQGNLETTVNGDTKTTTSGSFTNTANTITSTASGAHTLKGSPLSLN